ncbi:hypothetical protein QQX98_011486 [Neonectria punicea]|uniref:Uncharacterized protein n=1 Tax=Neonectria punicea TaxID=979145 RepID=A0ABR1GLL7_9HYPO
MCHVTEYRKRCEDCRRVEPTHASTTDPCHAVRNRRKCKGKSFGFKYEKKVCIDCHQERCFQGRTYYTV